MNKLAQILGTKAMEVAARRRLRSISDLDRVEVQPARGFEAALRAKTADHKFALIAEIKRSSPARGLIRETFHPASHARDFAAGGAACLSVLTDAPWFDGHEEYLAAARAACALPALRKDFILDPWQVAESRAIGADAILLIVGAVPDGTMREIEAAAFERGLDVVVEVHDEKELDRALSRLKSNLIAINNRDLRTFAIDLSVTERLARRIPKDRLVIAASGIRTHDDCARLAAHGVRAVLVGETLMRSYDIATSTRALLDPDIIVPPPPRRTSPTRRSPRSGYISATV